LPVAPAKRTSLNRKNSAKTPAPPCSVFDKSHPHPTQLVKNVAECDRISSISRNPPLLVLFCRVETRRDPRFLPGHE
jgi:hypothetical protein